MGQQALLTQVTRHWRRLAPIFVAMQLAGLSVVIITQGYLATYYEPDRAAQPLALVTLILGAALFMLGVAGSNTDDDTHDEPWRQTFSSDSFRTDRITPLRTSITCAGALLMAVLLLRLILGSTSGLDLLLWSAAVCSLSAPFVHSPTLSLTNSKRLWMSYRTDILIVAMFVGIFIGLNTLDLTDWYYSAIGDEFAHFSYARSLAENGLRQPFDLDGVYSGVDPTMAAIYPALIMKLVGIDQFGWKFSQIISVALTVPGIYLLGHLIGGRLTAVVSTGVLSFSHYVFAFVHTGYPNIDAMVFLVWPITLFVLGIRRGSPLLLFASGFLAGAGLLFNIVARAAIPIIILFALNHSGIRKQMIRLWPWLLGASLTVVPLLLVNGTEVFSTVLLKIISPDSTHSTEYDGVASTIIANASRNLLAFNYNANTSHYVSGSLLDSISAAFALLGLAYCLGTLNKTSSRLLLMMFTVIATGTALLSPYPYVPISRMPAMVIPLALMAGVAVAHIGGLPTKAALTRKLCKGVRGIPILMILLVAIFALNALRFWVVTPGIVHTTPEATAIGALRSNDCAGDMPKVVLVIKEIEPLLRPAIESYRPDGELPHLISYSQLNSGIIWLPMFPRCVIFLAPQDTEVSKLREHLHNRFPDGQFSSFSSPSGTTTVEIFSRPSDSTP